MEKTRKLPMLLQETLVVCVRAKPAPRLTTQLPPFLQGLALHSSISASQLAPVYPGRQEHV